MSMDLSEFHEAFFEESLEALDDMESSLLSLDIGTPDTDAINTIFRGAHSVKGGSGMFGFTEITGFTHVLETLLDKIRNGEKQTTQHLVDSLLQAVDCLREMLRATQAGEPIARKRVNTLQAELEAQLENSAGADTAPPEPASNAALEAAAPRWRIDFRPHLGMLASANEPARIFEELGQLGDLETTVDISAVPAFEDIAPEQCYLRWTIELATAATHEQIAELFEWVEFDCDLKIEALGGNPAPSATVSEVPAQISGGDATEAQMHAAGSGPKPPPKSDQRGSPPKDASHKRGAADSGSIRVSIDKVDDVINLVGELVITQSMLRRFGEEGAALDLESLKEGLNDLERNMQELQQTIMRIRMLPISFSFNRFPRLVRDLSAQLGKKIDLQIHGGETELDKTVLEKIGDPLVHLVRNSLDHGIETPAERVAAGKPETGVLTLNAYHAGGNIVIKVKDDGRGLPCEKILAKARQRGLVDENEELSIEQIHNLIFHAGFSTADNISELSGRGVGMDVVRRNIKDLGGNVEVTSEPGKGSTFTVKLPLTLAILDGQLIGVGSEIYVISLASIVESIQVTAQNIGGLAQRGELYRVRDEYIPIIRLHERFGVEPRSRELTGGLLVVVESEGTRVGLFVDDLLSQQQVVIKSLKTHFRQVEGLSGATILGNGTVALIIDVPGLIQSVQSQAASRGQLLSERVA